MDVISLLGYLIEAAQSDPAVKGYKVGFDGQQHPIFEVNVNGNIEQITFLVSDPTRKGLVPALISRRREDSNGRT